MPESSLRQTPDGAPGLNYLCAGFKKAYRAMDPFMKRMIDLINKGLPVRKIMESSGDIPA